MAAAAPKQGWQPGQLAAAQWKPAFRMGDVECGGLVNYADDSSSSTSDCDVGELGTSMKLQYSAVSSFLTSSLIQVNDS
jgi:hypothetical protein